ncbi:MAG TPA: aroma-sacti cluster domain-containing protein [Gaiella sp.]|uniref:aroma-sacti cluster domain-containing protein n=1 Tax=Gaiella sp. TaxID=2663207 RepID=UPI002D7E5308|nr:aroma-sacti cluster domain-containing protein [Gaiella sp.]HET9286409.1 aroma-sacti cluster domain-containing protein [Gaiella sp.]
MPTNGGSNLDKLTQHGLIRQDLPEPFARLVDGLTRHEVETLVAMKKRLDAAGAWHGLGEGTTGELPPWTTFMVF